MLVLPIFEREPSLEEVTEYQLLILKNAFMSRIKSEGTLKNLDKLSFEPISIFI